MWKADKDDGVILSYQCPYPYFREESQGGWPPVGYLYLFFCLSLCPCLSLFLFLCLYLLEGRRWDAESRGHNQIAREPGRGGCDCAILLEGEVGR